MVSAVLLVVRYASSSTFLIYCFFRNMKLPPSQVLPQTEFELDARITEFIENQINDEFNLMKQKLAFKLAKSKLRLNKLKNYFLENISTIETEVTGIR